MSDLLNAIIEGEDSTQPSCRLYHVRELESLAHYAIY
ncbi:MAG: hypothetical protein ACI8Z1_000846 [Candidatus Azotimanducaceae bacterium]|jgi:hypothetical protein